LIAVGLARLGKPRLMLAAGGESLVYVMH